MYGHFNVLLELRVSQASAAPEMHYDFRCSSGPCVSGFASQWQRNTRSCLDTIIVEQPSVLLVSVNVSCANRIEPANPRYHRSHLFCCHFREDRQRQDARLMPIGHRKVRGTVPEAPVSGEKGKRPGIVDHRLNAPVRKVTGQLIPALVLHHVEMVHVLQSGCFLWKRNPLYCAEVAMVFTGNLAAPRCPAREMPQFHQEHSRLKSVQSAVDALDPVIPFYQTAMPSEHRHAFGERRIVCQNGTCITHRPQVLAGIEGERGHRSKRAYVATFIARQMRLRAILNHP